MDDVIEMAAREGDTTSASASGATGPAGGLAMASGRSAEGRAGARDDGHRAGSVRDEAAAAGSSGRKRERRHSASSSDDSDDDSDSESSESESESDSSEEKKLHSTYMCWLVKV